MQRHCCLTYHTAQIQLDNWYSITKVLYTTYDSVIFFYDLPSDIFKNMEYYIYYLQEFSCFSNFPFYYSFE